MQERSKNVDRAEEDEEESGDGRIVLLTSFILSVFADWVPLREPARYVNHASW